ncbi:hypothetical protein JHJ32_14360 [Parapedobacter sp. ISTM3]|uniref:hypothetical protein n=1 Tax=Parapedobacter sp. ISTM3 TaxID=2800130 RepID=UPI0019085A4E|nr:hypothetical protein [Parapedobacter sp. ISTM3]MBK1441178.1 hypothetical protein [Parapedobacter sp. ISTM3]
MKQRFIVGLACMALAGCTKDSPRDDSPSSATKHLQRYVTTSDGESVTYILTYDTKNRLIAYNSQEDDYRSRITYDNNDNPIRFELESTGAKQVFEITYNSAGVPLRAISVLSDLDNPDEELETEITYEVTGGKISKMHFADETGNEAVYTLSYMGNNLTRVAYTASDGELVLTWNYGNKKSAYSAARFNYLVIPDLFSVFSSENEIIQSRLEIAGLGSFTTTYTYQFDATGYPTAATEKDQDGNESQIAFFYN